MKGETEKVHTCGQSIWVKGWVEGRTIFYTGPPDKKVWVEHCPKCGERLSLEDLRDETDWKWA
jgi:hypothetical protein